MTLTKKNKEYISKNIVKEINKLKKIVNKKIKTKTKKNKKLIDIINENITEIKKDVNKIKKNNSSNVNISGGVGTSNSDNNNSILSSIQSIEDNINTIENNINTLDTNYTTLSNSINTLNTTNITLSNSINTLTTNYTSLSNKLSTIENNYDSLLTNYNLLSSNYTTLNNRMNIIENNYIDLDSSNSVTLNTFVEKLSIINPIFRKHQLYLDLLGIPLAKKILLDSNIEYGNNVTVGVLDDGVDLNHVDLNVNKSISNAYNSKNLTMDDTHGTAVAGIIASKGNKYTEGIAPKVELISINVLGDGAIWNEPLKYRTDLIDIYNNSYGAPITPSNNYATIKNQVEYGIINGRNGKGCIYVFASGNSHDSGDEANLSEFLNTEGSIVVGAINPNVNTKSLYSENGSNLLCCAIGGLDSSFSLQGVITLSNSIVNPFDMSFNGTSASMSTSFRNNSITFV